MSKFNEALKRVLVHEGGYVNNPDDPGGETMNGITVAVAREHGYKGDMKDLPFDVVADIYYESYWKPVYGDKLVFDVAFQLFDAAVNHGVSRAVKWAQKCADYKVKADGIMGPKTFQAVACTHQADFITKLNAERVRFYTDLDNFDKFGKGWLRRVAMNLNHAAEDMAKGRMTAS